MSGETWGQPWGHGGDGCGGEGKGAGAPRWGGRAVVEQRPLRMRAEADGAAFTWSCVQLCWVLNDG